MTPYDIIIIGSGFAGSAAAIMLAREGFHIAVIDRDPICRPQFRAEQLVGHQVHTLADMGLLSTVVGDTVPVYRASCYEAGRLIRRISAPHYGIDYPDMVANLRRVIPRSVTQYTGTVAEIEVAGSHRTVRLVDGRCFQATLVILATGLQKSLLNQIGAEVSVISSYHSVAFGFDVRLAKPHPDVMVYYGDTSNGIDYLTLFPFKDRRVRANLFGYHPSPMRAGLTAMDGLHTLLPRLHEAIGPVEITTRPRFVLNTVSAVTTRATGIVAIGDAAQTPCPTAGTGIGRLLVDVTALIRHVPRWLRRSGSVTPDDLAAFHHDPARLAANTRAIHDALYMKNRRIGTSLGWKLHRFRVRTQARVMSMA